MADLVRARTEIECVINDFEQADQSGEERREEAGKELDALEKRMEEVTERLLGANQDLEDRVAEEREANEA